MPRPSSAEDARTRRAYRIMAVPFAVLTAYLLSIFGAGLARGDIRTDIPLYFLFTGACAVGLWRVTQWGRSLTLIFAVGNAGLGALGVLAVILDGAFNPGPALQLAAALAVGYALTRSVFTIGEEPE